MRKLIEFILNLVCTFIFILGCLFNFTYLLLKYILQSLFKAYNKALKEGYDNLDKGF